MEKMTYMRNYKKCFNTYYYNKVIWNRSEIKIINLDS